MKSFFSAVALTAIFLFSGCVMSHPQTAQEFRAAVPGAFMAEVETIEVDRPLSEVTETFKKRAPKCLDVRIRTVSQSNTSYQVLVADFHPTVIAGKNKTELHLQRHYENGVINISEEPKNGYYLIVVDAIALEQKRTKVVFYKPSIGFDSLITAIKGWASGKSTECPDMTE